MRIGVPTEIKTREYRVGMIPAGVRALHHHGHEVLVQAGAGLGAGISDKEYEVAGARLVATADEVWGEADLIFKVKEPLPPEYARMRRGQTVYTYFHLAAAPELARVLLEREVTAVAYETIETDDGKLPLLEPMSAIAGRMSIQVGAAFLEKEHGGKGILLGGVAGVRRGRVAIIGGGVVGASAARIAIGYGADVTVLDVNLGILKYLDDIYQGRIHTMYSDAHTIEEAAVRADLVVGAVLVTGARAPKLVTSDMVRAMEPGTVIVDVAVDQGGCVETADHPTTHDNPTYVVHDVTHYAVANMPGAVPRTSTFALNNATLPYGLRIANQGILAAARADRAIARGINTHQGRITHKAVAGAVGEAFHAIEALS
jgi:alanine dehydrogenase